MDENDQYWKLRPPEPTPNDELCSCDGSPPIVLQPHLSSNPLVCFACNREVPPERIGFSESLAEELASWQSFHDCFYRLWLDSGEFESWADEQLSDPESPVNRRGRALVSKLAEFRNAYYWWFQDPGADGFRPLSRCPICNGALTPRSMVHSCEPCAIVVAN